VSTTGYIYKNGNDIPRVDTRRKVEIKTSPISKTEKEEKIMKLMKEA